MQRSARRGTRKDVARVVIAGGTRKDVARVVIAAASAQVATLGGFRLMV